MVIISEFSDGRHSIGGDTVFVIEGNNPAEVQDEIDKYFRNYAPEGYGTRIYSDVTFNGNRTVKITRWNSCD